MTLNEWVKQGNPMLSSYTAAWACQVARISINALRQMTLTEIFKIPMAGEVAKREVDRWARGAA